MKKFLVLSSWSAAIGSMLIAAFAVVGCDDSSSASAGPNDEPSVESSSSIERGESSSSVIPGNDPESSSEKAKSSSSATQSDAKQSSSSEKDKSSSSVEVQSSSSEKSGMSSSSVNDVSSSSGKSESSSSVEMPKSSSSVVESSSCVSSSSSIVTSESSSSKDPELAEGSSSSSEYVEAISSSVDASSSSVMSVYDAENNTLTDLRDNRVYKTVTVGEQIWMAENMSYETTNSTCYNDTAEYCEKYGRLYTWDTVGICPEGWHLPDNTEWEALFTAVGGQSVAGTMLKSQSGWIDNSNGSGNGTDSFGFTALPAGYRGDEYEEYNFYGDGEYTFFWSASEFTEGDPYYMNLYFSLLGAYLELSPGGGYSMSVRCLKDK